MTRVRTPSRLHFGLFALPADAAAPAWPTRAFGGVGLMIEQPGLTVTAEPATSWSSEGPLAERGVAFARMASATPMHISVATTVREHVGLGTGTQLGLAVARAIRGDLSAVELARSVGRGQRSALGIHGFAQGGFLVEGGKRGPGAISPLVARAAFPNAWRVVLIIPRDLRGVDGPREQDAFRALGQGAPDLARTDALCRLVLLGMLPALAELDLDAFGESLYEFNRRVGEMFRPWQGGLYAHPHIGALVAALRAEGVRGVGQSSWGPTVFAVVAGDDAERVRAALMGKHGCRADEVLVTVASNRGADVIPIESYREGCA
jgi:beta-RFAP synthase